jgi:hypothetical protein
LHECNLIKSESKMDARDAQETIEQVAERGGQRVALLISILAGMLALVGVSGGNAEQDATKANIDAANLWSFYQAKTIRRSNLQQLTELVELELPDLPPDRAERTRQRLEAWRATAERYETEPATNEGRKELAARAKAAEDVRDRALAADNMFDYGSAALQLAIVLASASIVVGVAWLAWLARAFGVIGVAFALLGWFAPTLIPF